MLCNIVRETQISAEIRLVITLDVTNASYSESARPGTQVIDMGEQYAASGIQVVGYAAAELLDMGDVVSAGWCYLRNLSLTQVINYGSMDGPDLVPLGRLFPSEACAFRLATNSLGVQTVAGTVNTSARLHYIVLNT